MISILYFVLGVTLLTVSVTNVARILYPKWFISRRRRLRRVLATAIVWLAHRVDPDNHHRMLEVYNENLNEELNRERNARNTLNGEIRWLRARVQELENQGKETAN